MERSNFEFEHDYVQERIENMASEDLMTLIIVFVLAVAFGVLSACSFMEKGYLLNNQYLNASKEERESMDKRPYYRQTVGHMFPLVQHYVLYLRNTNAGRS